MGSGRLRLADCTYEGDFKDDYKHGVGMLTWDDGRRYHGQFEYGRFSGNAVMSWPDGRRYCGQYLEDVKHGEGTFTWADGRRYQGQWRAGKRDGVGVYTTAKGDTRTGLWQVDRPITWDTSGPVSRSRNHRAWIWLSTERRVSQCEQKGADQLEKVHFACGRVTGVEHFLALSWSCVHSKK